MISPHIFAKCFDNEWSNEVMARMAKDSGIGIEQAIAAVRAEYAENGVPTPYDPEWKGNKRAQP